ncbi:hypothetical protein N7504_004420 [Penicillium tannophilum]|nr:hypothetical protein N7504_004420 [Penicillium tannophilum]
MKFFTAVCFVALASLGLASPLEQQKRATCATCSQGCLNVDTGDCYPQWPQSVCDTYSGNHSKDGNGVHEYDWNHAARYQAEKNIGM